MIRAFCKLSIAIIVVAYLLEVPFKGGSNNKNTNYTNNTISSSESDQNGTKATDSKLGKTTVKKSKHVKKHKKQEKKKVSIKVKTAKKKSK